MMEETIVKELMAQGPLGFLCAVLLFAFYRFAKYHVDREREYNHERERYLQELKDIQSTLFEVLSQNAVMLDRIAKYFPTNGDNEHSRGRDKK